MKSQSPVRSDWTVASQTIVNQRYLGNIIPLFTVETKSKPHRIGAKDSLQLVHLLQQAREVSASEWVAYLVIEIAAILTLTISFAHAFH